MTLAVKRHKTIYIHSFIHSFIMSLIFSINGLNPFPHTSIYHHSASATDDFWNHCGKRWNMSNCSIATTISTLFNYLTIIYRDYLCFVFDDFKVCPVKHHWNQCGKRRNCWYWAIMICIYHNNFEHFSVIILSFYRFFIFCTW